mmetsp:Transcript_21143/g.42147  ORF Transcript_21143/g.42147 Transcript_21143/m.42147 type:complete len:228 (+) Transcript_21143:604-1287(+)
MRIGVVEAAQERLAGKSCPHRHGEARRKGRCPEAKEEERLTGRASRFLERARQVAEVEFLAFIQIVSSPHDDDEEGKYCGHNRGEEDSTSGLGERQALCKAARQKDVDGQTRGCDHSKSNGGASCGESRLESYKELFDVGSYLPSRDTKGHHHYHDDEPQALRYRVDLPAEENDCDQDAQYGGYDTPDYAVQGLRRRVVVVNSSPHPGDLGAFQESHGDDNKSCHKE